MAPVSMVFHVSYMRSLCKKEWRTVRQMILSAVRNGVAEEFVPFCAGLFVNKRSRITLDRVCKAVAQKQWPRWLTTFSKQAYYLWLGMRRVALPEAAVPSGESNSAVMQADSRKLVHVGLTKPSRLSVADQGPLQFRKLWRSIVRRDVVVWLDNWWHAQFRANPVKPDTCLDVTAIAVLHTTPLPLFLGHPSVQDLVDRADTLPVAFVQLHREMSKVCTDLCNAPISQRTMRAPLYIAREAGRQQLFWKQHSIYEFRTGQNQELLDVLDMLRSTQPHCQNPMALLVDCNMHYRVLKFLYSRATIDWNFSGLDAGYLVNLRRLAPLQTCLEYHVA